MKIKLFILLAAISFSAATFAQEANTMYVEINGVKWATRNVAAPGTFVEKPEDAGMMFQWNRRIGWSATKPMINSDGGTEWNATEPEGGTWEKSNDPSPAGWRVPTSEEIQKLLDKDKVSSEWTTVNGVKGRRFTDKASGNSLFLPAAGGRNHSDGTLYDAGSGGYCWSSTAHESLNTNAYILVFYSDGAGSGGAIRRVGFSVRSVAE